MPDNDRPLRHDALLVLIGVLAGSVPTLFVTYSEINAERERTVLDHNLQRDQMLLEHKIKAFQDYSATYSSIIENLYRTIDASLPTVLMLDVISKQPTPVNIDRYRTVRATRTTERDKLRIESTRVQGEMATHTVVMNTLLGIRLDPLTWSPGISNPDFGKVIRDTQTDLQVIQGEMESHKKTIATLQDTYKRNLILIEQHLKLNSQ